MTGDAPNDDHHRAVLEERAVRLATPLAATGVLRRDHYALFRVGNELVAIHTTSVSELVRVAAYAPLHRVAPWFVGVAHHHGEPFTVLDLGIYLGKGATTHPVGLVILEAGGRKMGMLAGEVVGLHEIDEGQFAHGLGTFDPSVTATTRNLVSIVDVDQLFADARVVIDIATPASRQRP